MNCDSDADGADDLDVSFGVEVPDEPGGFIYADRLDGVDDYGIGRVCYAGPFAFIANERISCRDECFSPAMQWAMKRQVWREQWRLAFFCSGRCVYTLEPFSSWFYKLKHWYHRWF